MIPRPLCESGYCYETDCKMLDGQNLAGKGNVWGLKSGPFLTPIWSDLVFPSYCNAMNAPIDKLYVSQERPRWISIVCCCINSMAQMEIFQPLLGWLAPSGMNVMILDPLWFSVCWRLWFVQHHQHCCILNMPKNNCTLCRAISIAVVFELLKMRGKD